MVGIAEQNTRKYLNKIKNNTKLNIFLHINDGAVDEARLIDERVAKTGKRGRLYGKVIAIKSNINVKGIITNCASKVLENYIAPYDATVVKKIKKEEGVIIGMVNMDEFALGSSGENSAFGCCVNPAASDRVPGGTSSGSAAAVAAGLCDMALGSDTGGSLRAPASNCGVVGVKPSYGRVSRYGLIDSAMSFDQIGPIAVNVSDAALLLDVIKGKDEKDTQSFEGSEIKISEVGKIKVGTLKIKGVNKKIQKLVDNKVKRVVAKYGWKSDDVEIKHINLAVETYYPIQYVEFFSGTRRFDGRRYGHKIEEKGGKEVIRRILGGQEITKAEFKGEYYKKALEVKELIKEEFEKVFEKYDCIILPTMPVVPWKVGEGLKMKPEEVYAADACTSPANLAEICAVSIPCGKIKEGKEELPIGLQIMCGKGQEGKMLSIANAVENVA